MKYMSKSVLVLTSVMICTSSWAVIEQYDINVTNMRSQPVDVSWASSSTTGLTTQTTTPRTVQQKATETFSEYDRTKTAKGIFGGRKIIVKIGGAKFWKIIPKEMKVVQISTQSTDPIRDANGQKFESAQPEEKPQTTQGGATGFAGGAKQLSEKYKQQYGGK